jgi:hypothetical protein
VDRRSGFATRANAQNADKMNPITKQSRVALSFMLEFLSKLGFGFKIMVNALLLLFAFFIGCNAPKKTTSAIPPKDLPMITHPLNLANETFWKNPDRALNDYLSNKPWESDLLEIDCPEYVSLDSRETIPMLIAARLGTSIDYEFPFKQRVMGVVTNLETGRVFTGSVFPGEMPAAKTGYTPGGVGIEEVVDARGVFSIPWDIGSYQVCLVYMDRVSNQCRFQLTKSEAAYRSGAEAEALLKMKQSPPRRLPEAMNGQGVVFPKNPGRALKDPGIVTHSSHQVLRLSDTSAEAAIDYMVPVRDSDTEEITIEGIGSVHTVIPMTVVIFDAFEFKRVIEFNAPGFQPALVKDNITYATGSALIDLLKIPGMELEPSDNYYLYAFSNGFSAGPLLMKSASKDSGKEPGYIIPPPKEELPVMPQ